MNQNAKRIMSLITMIMSIMLIILLMIPACFTEGNWIYDTSSITYHGSATHIFSKGVNIFGIDTVAARILASLVVLFLVLSTIAFLVKYLNIENVFTKLAGFYSLVSLAFFIALIVHQGVAGQQELYGGFIRYEISWLSFIVIAFYVILIILGLILTFKKFSPVLSTAYQYKAQVQYDSEQVPISSAADDLLRLKTLLDQGIITQEEFDAKKKQLLGV